jgi:hypothetical protein
MGVNISIMFGGITRERLKNGFRESPDTQFAQMTIYGFWSNP